MTPGVVTLYPEKFRALYPEFSNVTDPQLEGVLSTSDLYLENDAQSCIQDLKKREYLLYMITAHMLYLRYGNNKGRGGTGLVGRISSASEGSVSVGSELGSMRFNQAWYAQSPYGLDFWMATKICRMPKYYPGSDYERGR